MAYLLKIIALLFFAFALVKTGSVSFEDCGSDYIIKDISIEGCEGFPCHVKIGSLQNITLKLDATFTSRNFTHYAAVRAPIINVLKVHPTLPCNKILCPVRSGTQLVFQPTIEIKGNLIEGDAELHMTMHNDYSAQVLCMKTDLILY